MLYIIKIPVCREQQLRQFYNKTASEHLCVKSINALFLSFRGQKRKAAFGQIVQKLKLKRRRITNVQQKWYSMGKTTYTCQEAQRE